MALSTQKIVATAFITSGIGCRGLLPGDGAGFMVRTFPQIPAVKTNILKFAHTWVERTRGVAVLLQCESVAGTMQTSGRMPKSQQSGTRWPGG